MKQSVACNEIIYNLLLRSKLKNTGKQSTNYDYKFNLCQISSIYDFLYNIESLIDIRIVQDIQIYFLFIKNYIISKFDVNIKFRSSSAIELFTNIFTFKISHQSIYFYILDFALSVYLLYYGFEKCYEFYGLSTLSWSLLFNLLDFFNLYLGFKLLFHSKKIFHDQQKLLVTFNFTIFEFILIELNYMVLVLLLIIAFAVIILIIRRSITFILTVMPQ